MVSAYRPDELADAMFEGNLVATYADLITPAVAEQFAGRLFSIDRGQGDPLVRAQVVDFRSGGYTIADGLERLYQFIGEHRPYVTAYVDREKWREVRSRCHGIEPLWWVVSPGGVLNPDGRYPAMVQFAGEFQIGRRVQVSLVYDERLTALGYQAPQASAPLAPAPLDHQSARAARVVDYLMGD